MGSLIAEQWIVIARSIENAAWCNMMPNDRKAVTKAYHVQVAPVMLQLCDALVITPKGYASIACSQSPTAMLRISLFDGVHKVRSLVNTTSTRVFRLIAMTARSAYTPVMTSYIGSLKASSGSSPPLLFMKSGMLFPMKYLLRPWKWERNNEITKTFGVNASF